MTIRSARSRHMANSAILRISTLAAMVGLAMLIWILGVVMKEGFGAFDLDFFTKLPTPPGMAGGGLANAIAGTIMMTVLAILLAVPISILAGIHLAEYGKGAKLATSMRFVTSTLMGVPSIIMGVFVYTLVVKPTHTFSGYSGSIALAIIMLPVVVRTTEDMLNLVPVALREAGLALGAPHWKVILQIVFRSAKGGLLTGVLLAVARVSGETAPLLFTALNSPYWMHSLNEPLANLTVTIFNFAMSPYADWKSQAWGASLLITGGVLLLNISARLAFRDRNRNK